MSTPSAFWTEERIYRLRDLIHSGATSGTAAQILGCTRNAVIGKAFRLELRFQCGKSQPDMKWQFLCQRRFRALDWKIHLAMKVLAHPEPPPRNPKLCADPTCRNTRQPGRDFCASCLRPERRAA